MYTQKYTAGTRIIIKPSSLEFYLDSGAGILVGLEGNIIESLYERNQRKESMPAAMLAKLAHGVNTYRVLVHGHSEIILVSECDMIEKIYQVPTPLAKHRDTPLLPPKAAQRFAGHHWVTRLDYDGRRTHMEVFQWQPSARTWARPGYVATGENNLLNGYVYIGSCPTPMFEEDAVLFRQVMDKVKKSKKLTPDEFSILRVGVADYMAISHSETISRL